MKKLIVIMTIMLSWNNTMAQNTQKHSVMLDNLKHSTTVSKAHKDMVRAAILTGLTKTGRLNIVDVANIQAMAMKQENNEVPTVENISNQFMNETGGTKLISGIVTVVGATKHKNETDGSIYYRGNVNFSINVVDIKSGNSIAGEDFSIGGTYGATGKTQQEAIVATINKIASRIDGFVDNNFKVYTKILQAEAGNSKKTKTLYINIGSSMGVNNGQIFIVYHDENIAGITSRKEVAKLRVQDVRGPEISLCKVTSGGKNLPELILQEVDLMVESAGKSMFSSFVQ